MTKRLVVCMRWRPEEGDASEQHFANVAEGVFERTAALGGRLILWHPEWLGVDFGLDELQDAIDFLIDRPSGSFSIGFSHGAVKEWVDGGPLLAACSGPAVDLAVALARMARAGEVLVDPQLVKASGGELLVSGARVAMVNAERIRGLKLDLAHPQRSLECESVGRLVLPEPSYDGVIERAPERGALLRVVSGDGGGGSSFLRKHRAHHTPLGLWISPYAGGEPLAALTRALGVAPAGDDAAWKVRHQDALDALSTGRGMGQARGAELLQAWYREHDGAAAVYVEDASEVDHDTLECVARVVESGDVGCVVLAAQRDLPEPLARLSEVARVELEPLSESEATTLVLDMTGGHAPAEQVERLVARGMPEPLGVVQSVVEALDSAALLWTDSGIVPRVKREETTDPQSALTLYQRRLHFVDPVDRLILDALAVLGGSAELGQVQGVLKAAGRAVTRFDASVDYLTRTRWIALAGVDVITLANRTCRRALIEQLSDRRFAALHQGAAVLYGSSGRPLALGAAAVHALLAGNEGKAVLLARRAAASANSAGLAETARAFERYADTKDSSALKARGLMGPSGAEHAGTEAPEAHDDHLFPSSVDNVPTTDPAAASAPRQGEAPPSSVDASRPDSVPRVDPPPSEPLDLASFRPPGLVPPPLPKRRAAPTLPEAAENEEETTPDSAPDAGERTSKIDVGSLESDGDSLLPAKAYAALRHGDANTLDELAQQLRAESQNTVANRLDALAALLRGEVGDALRRLRDAKDVARSSDGRAQCRASLGLSIGLAAAGRDSEALLEALDGLARARATNDQRGERACAKFLARLARRGGHDSAADAWQAIGE